MIKLKSAKELLKAEKLLLKIELYKEINLKVWQKFPEALKYKQSLIKKYLVPLLRELSK